MRYDQWGILMSKTARLAIVWGNKCDIGVAFGETVPRSNSTGHPSPHRLALGSLPNVRVVSISAAENAIEEEGEVATH